MTSWMCVGVPPKLPPCGAEGTTDREAERHVKDTGHGTTSGTPNGVRTIHQAFTTGDTAA